MLHIQILNKFLLVFVFFLLCTCNNYANKHSGGYLNSFLHNKSLQPMLVNTAWFCPLTQNSDHLVHNL